MAGFSFTELDLKGAYLIKNFHAGDMRGGFTKNFEKDIYKDGGIDFQLSESFTSLSMKGVVRGLHFQTNRPQAKLVSVVAGRLWDVIVDLRANSPTFKQWRAQELSAENHLSFYIPRGFAHGFVSFEDGTVILYQCDGKYDATTDTGIRFDDPDINVEWPFEVIGGKESVIISERDSKLMSFQHFSGGL